METIILIIFIIGCFTITDIVIQSIFFIGCTFTKSKKKNKPCKNWLCPEYKWCNNSRYFRRMVDDNLNKIETEKEKE